MFKVLKSLCCSIYNACIYYDSARWIEDYVVHNKHYASYQLCIQLIRLVYHELLQQCDIYLIWYYHWLLHTLPWRRLIWQQYSDCINQLRLLVIPPDWGQVLPVGCGSSHFFFRNGILHNWKMLTLLWICMFKLIWIILVLFSMWPSFHAINILDKLGFISTDTTFSVTCAIGRVNKIIFYFGKQHSDWGHLIHWGRVMHICISKLTLIGSDDGLLPGWQHAIIWTYTGMLLIGPLGTNLSEILIEIYTFSSREMHLKILYVKRQPDVSASTCKCCFKSQQCRV